MARPPASVSQAHLHRNVEQKIIHHTLPPEIIRRSEASTPSTRRPRSLTVLPIVPTVFLFASPDRATMSSVSLVCQIAHKWLLPVLYHSVTLSTSSKLCSFYSAHNSSDLSGPNRMSLVQRLWIGGTRRNEGDLQYASTSWPLTIIHGILALCTNLRTFVIINLSQNIWFRLECVIPATLEVLSMGPIHGPFSLKDLKHCPQIRSFTSAHTFMRDDEVRDLVLSASLRHFRRIVGLDTLHIYALDQLSCVSRSRTLEEMQLVLCGPESDDMLVEEVEGNLRTITEDKRVVISRVLADDWIAMLYNEFRREEADYSYSMLGNS